MQRRSPFWERWPTPIWFCILFPVLNFASHECFPSIKFWKALSDGANMILLWTKKERVEFLLMFVFSYILPPAWSFCSYWPTMQLQRDSMCTNFNRQSNYRYDTFIERSCEQLNIARRQQMNVEITAKIKRLICCDGHYPSTTRRTTFNYIDWTYHFS